MNSNNTYLAKYPFFEDAKGALDDVDIETVLQNQDVLVRAVERVVRGVNKGTLSSFKQNPGQYDKRFEPELEVEVQSYPVARMLVSLIGDYRIVNRYSRAEAQTALKRLEDEVNNKYAQNSTSIGDGKQYITLEDALTEFDIDAKPTELNEELHRTYLSEFFETADGDEIRSFADEVFKVENVNEVFSDDLLANLDSSDIYELLHTHSGNDRDTDWYRLSFISYIQTAVGMNESRWRLTNRGINNGDLIIPLDDLFTLFEEAVHQRVGDELPYDVPDKIRNIIREAEPFAGMDDVPDFWDGLPCRREEVIETESDNEGTADNEYNFVELVRAAIDDDYFSYEINRVEPGLFPPVIDRLLEGVRNGENLKHEARFTLAAFCINIGMTEDEIVELLGVGGSFGEEATRYQVGHIQQGGGSGDPYTPANYATMESWGLEWEKDALEAQVTNPLTYYKIKLKDQEEDGEQEENEDEDEEDEDASTTEVSPKKMPDGMQQTLTDHSSDEDEED